jgi:TolA-binding protein
MKTILIRTMTFVVLATSISAFAQTSDTKREDAATTLNTTQQNDSNQEAYDPAESSISQKLDQLQDEVQQLERQVNQVEEQQPSQEEIRHEDKQWDDSLLGIYGG